MNYLLARKIAYLFTEHSPLSKLPALFFPWGTAKRGFGTYFMGLGIETTNRCNCHCLFCGHRRMTRTKGEMSMELCEKIVGDFSDIGGGIIIFGGSAGEALMDTRILERIRLARRFDNIRLVSIHTCGILHDKLGLKDLLDSGVYRMRINIPGHNREAYKRMTGVDMFDSVEANVVELLELNNRMGRPVDIRIEFRADAPMSQVVKEKAFQRFRSLTDLIDYKIFYHNWAGAVRSEDIPRTMRKERMRRRKGPCYILYRCPRVFWNGDVSACSSNVDGHPSLIFGNVRDSHIIQLWQSEARKELLARFAIGDLPEPCRHCSRYKPFYSTLRIRRVAKRAYQNFLSSDYCRRTNADSLST